MGAPTVTWPLAQCLSRALGVLTWAGTVRPECLLSPLGGTASVPPELGTPVLEWQG